MHNMHNMTQWNTAKSSFKDTKGKGHSKHVVSVCVCDMIYIIMQLAPLNRLKVVNFFHRQTFLKGRIFPKNIKKKSYK